MSVLEMAQQLTARARTYSEESKDRDERTRIGNALEEVGRTLGALTTTANAYSAARDAGVPLNQLAVPTDLLTLRSEGLPSSQALVAARKRTEKLAKDARDAVSAAWRGWAQEQFAAVNPGRVSRLSVQHRRRADELQKRLAAAINAKEIQAGQIDQFRRDLTEFDAMLASIREDDPIVLLLGKIRSGRITLADLTDGELDSLRADHSAASQVILQAT
jgi:hypothetical protein